MNIYITFIASQYGNNEITHIKFTKAKHITIQPASLIISRTDYGKTTNTMVPHTRHIKVQYFPSSTNPELKMLASSSKLIMKLSRFTCNTDASTIDIMPIFCI